MPYTDLSNEAENIYSVSGFETNEIKQVTEEICLEEQGTAEKRGRTNKPTKTAVNKKKEWWIHGEIMLSLQLLWPDIAPAAFPE